MHAICMCEREIEEEVGEWIVQCENFVAVWCLSEKVQRGHDTKYFILQETQLESN